MTKSTTTVRWRIPARAWVLIVLAIAAEALSNALRAYGLGSHLERFTVELPGYPPVSLAGVVMVLAAISVSLALSRAGWVALTPGPIGRRALAWMVGTILFAITITAMGLNLLEAQRAKIGGEVHDRDGYANAKKAYDAAKAEHDRLAGVRSTAEVRAAMDRTRVPAWAWEETKQCTAEASSMRPESLKQCRSVLDLRVEMGAAVTKAKAAAEMSDASKLMARLSPPAEQSAEEHLVFRVWAWLMGLGVVLLATFGSVLFAVPEEVTPPPASSLPEVPDLPDDGRPKVASWMEAYRQKNGAWPRAVDVERTFGMSTTSAWRIHGEVIEAAEAKTKKVKRA